MVIPGKLVWCGPALELFSGCKRAAGFRRTFVSAKNGQTAAILSSGVFAIRGVGNDVGHCVGNAGVGTGSGVGLGFGLGLGVVGENEGGANPGAGLGSNGEADDALLETWARRFPPATWQYTAVTFRAPSKTGVNWSWPTSPKASMHCWSDTLCVFLSGFSESPNTEIWMSQFLGFFALILA